LKIVETIWLKISELSTITLDPLLLTSELKKLLQSIDTNHLNRDIIEIGIDNSFPLEDFATKFQKSLRLISDLLLKQF
jgi:hypothetical protein